MNISTRFLLACFTLLVVSAHAQTTDSIPSVSQTTPIPIEAFVSDKGLLTQLVVSKKLEPQSKFGIFALTEYYGDFKNEANKNQFMAQTYLTYNVYKGLSVVGGAIITHQTGFRPSAGLQYVFMKNDFFVMLQPRMDLSETHNLEAFGFIEYTPKLTEKLGIYSRLQMMYNHNEKFNLHEVSYTRVRLGVSYKTYQMGLGANFASYGPDKVKEDSYGVFVRALLF
ncbi:hypothetical protein K5I29_03035 [Flavobacterium agricola]|uniref:DUF481 domain-containing protein n=1 Tax=Flavobacterium agricola TaxID=2870839 RepID=A0ABY6M2E6_9FLAO|nr:hypothetical protein [Flavobacterium agricola]UYW01905.1 hypothetical protein K5I29_03035 [Flavobacterium agricola]